MQTNDNQKYIYIRSLRERVPVTQEEFENYYREIDAFRKRQQRHGRCICPVAKRLDCDMDCETCPFRRAGDRLSLDYQGEDADETWLEELPDCGPSLCEIVEDADLLSALHRVLAELTPDEQAICRGIMEDLSERAAAAELSLSRTTYIYRRDKLLDRLKNLLQNFS